MLKDLSRVDLFDNPCNARVAVLRQRADIESLVRILSQLAQQHSVSVEAMVVCFTIMHVIHRRAPMCTAAVVIVRQGFQFSQDDVEEIAHVLCVRFMPSQLRWDIARQTQDATRNLCLLASNIAQVWDHASEVAKLPLWTVASINSLLDEKMPVLGLSAPYARAHHCRTLAALAPEVRGGGKVARMGREDWDSLVKVLSGTAAGLVRLQLQSLSRQRQQQGSVVPLGRGKALRTRW